MCLFPSLQVEFRVRSISFHPLRLRPPPQHQIKRTDTDPTYPRHLEPQVASAAHPKCTPRPNPPSSTLDSRDPRSPQRPTRNAPPFFRIFTPTPTPSSTADSWRPRFPQRPTPNASPFFLKIVASRPNPPPRQLEPQVASATHSKCTLGFFRIITSRPNPSPLLRRRQLARSPQRTTPNAPPSSFLGLFRQDHLPPSYISDSWNPRSPQSAAAPNPNETAYPRQSPDWWGSLEVK